MDKHLKPVALYDALLQLNSKDFDELANYLNYLQANFTVDDVDLNFYQYKNNSGLICICKIDDAKVGTIQLVADREGRV